MDVSRRRAGVKTSVVAGSVWETRMKVFTGDDQILDESSKKRTPNGTGTCVSGKRKTWKSQSFVGNFQTGKKIEEQSRELSVSSDRIKKNLAITGRRGGGRSGEKIPIQSNKGRSDCSIEKKENPIQIINSRSDIKDKLDSVDSGNKDIQINKSKDPDGEIEKNPPQIENIGCEDDNCKEFGVCEEETNSRSEEEEQEEEEERDDDEEDPKAEEEEIAIEVEKNSNIDTVEIRVAEEEDNKPTEVEIGRPQHKPNKKGEKNVYRQFRNRTQPPTSSTSKQNPPVMRRAEEEQGEERDDDEEDPKAEEEEEETAIEVVEKNSNFDTAEIEVAEEDNKPTEVEIGRPQHRPNMKGEKNVYRQFRNKTQAPTSSTFKQNPPVMRRAEIYQNLSKPTKPTSPVPLKNEYQNFHQRHSKLQNLVDLVMWKDISRSAFIFGIGTFIIISSSYAKDFNVSFISVLSYLGLVYLAAIFLYRSLICRGVIDVNDKSYILGEEEAIWLLKLFLPYLNESLLKIKALFSGDPSTTMKMAVLLFVFARCGSSITIWKMAKLGFFGVFLLPKVCSSYSPHLTAYAKFWIGRFRDAWDSCTHKKAVALAIFSLVWNLSSMVARVWAVFMMFVAVRYYQQSIESDDWEEVEAEDEGAGYNDTQTGGQNQRQGFGDGPASTPLEINKVKKGS